jgi:hypothetical protein
MTTFTVWVCGILMLAGCGSKNEPDSGNTQTPPLSEEVLSEISPVRMKATVDALAAEEMGGRIPGSLGHAQSMAWIVSEMTDIGLEPVGLEGDFVYPYATSGWEDHFQLEADGSVSVNVAEVGYDLVGRLPGADPDLAHEHILVMAHYDHLGVTIEGDAFNGAFDNASGVAVALELARLLSQPESRPARSLIFMLTDQEENGLNGASQWLNDPTIPLEQIVFGMSVDPVGRPSLPDFRPKLLMGTEYSPELDALWREAATWSEQPTIFINRDLIPVFASDQDELFKLDSPIPGLWFVNPGFSFYHTTEDTPETIDYRILVDDVRFLATAITLAGPEFPHFSYDNAFVSQGAAAAEGVQSMIDGILGSDVLDSGERTYAQWVSDELDIVIEQDDLTVLGSVEGFTMAVAYFVMFELGEAHPGPIPPPFPDGP